MQLVFKVRPVPFEFKDHLLAMNHSQKERGGLWHFDLTTDKWRSKSDYVGYEHWLKLGKFQMIKHFFKKRTRFSGLLVFVL